MQHVYGHTKNLGNKCADHAAALGALGLISSHCLTVRWARQTLDNAACFETCNNIGDVLEKLRDMFIRNHRISFGYLSALFLSLNPSRGLPQTPMNVFCTQHVQADHLFSVAFWTGQSRPPSIA